MVRQWRRAVLRGLMGLVLLAPATSPAFVCDFEDGWLSIFRAPGGFDDDGEWEDDFEDVFDD